ncbi:hypothetical protein [Nocardiopsis synnemataformans]|uniref:hypothetical protein n=1 Tax=Nocardiopsis synnemataformans TaxID=61305 RepID=UPI003EBF122C
MTGNRVPRTVSLLCHESRRCGPAVWALPVAGVAAGLTVLLFPPMARPVLLLVSCVALAGLAALCVVAVIGRERMWELHSSTPVRVPVMVARRLAIVAVLAAVAGAAAGGIASVPGARAEGTAVIVAGGAESAVAVSCTTALLAGVALCAWARWHSVSAASGALIAVWLGYALLWAVNVPPEVDRPVCALAGALLVWCGLRSLDDPARVLAKEAV